MDFIVAHAAVLSACGTGLSIFGGLWAAYFRFQQLLKAEIREYSASKEDVARVEGKVDLVINALIARGLKKEVR